MSHAYFNEESDYSENTGDNKVFRSTILHHRKNFYAIFTPKLQIYYIQY